MAPSANELQRNMFYNENWSVAMEFTFLGVLVQEITMGVAEPGYPDSYAIRVGMLEVNQTYGTFYDYNFFESKVRRLYERFLRFSKVLCLLGVLYDPIIKELSADQFVWDTAMERSPWIRIYVNKADPAWDDLSTIFTNPVDFPVRFQYANVHAPENAVHDTADVISLSPNSDNNSE
ncbi:hypothetical protein Salat_1113000 [Sesamum alatum]|uniref:Uncharacterized protein n=1 Tax=Sesamum alatum TaxID=300844 RepID=A0AAE1YP04_9LAMI|nr:hypothetical protein Salat_1113000 [Sesamum alatum]